MKAIADWEGCIRCIIDCEDKRAVEDYASPEGIRALLGMLGMLSEEDRKLYKGTGIENVMRKVGYSLDDDPESADMDEMAKIAGGLTIDDFKDFIFYASFLPERGVLKEMDPIPPGRYEDAAFNLSGKYSGWKTLCLGKASPIKLIMTRKLKLKGDLKYLTKHMAAMDGLVDVYKSIPLK
jgi:putative sterol carrier protein